MLSQPRVIDTKAVTPSLLLRGAGVEADDGLVGCEAKPLEKGVQLDPPGPRRLLEAVHSLQQEKDAARAQGSNLRHDLVDLAVRAVPPKQCTQLHQNRDVVMNRLAIDLLLELGVEKGSFQV